MRGTLLGLSLIPILFYTYNGVIGTSPDYINIAIFFISAAAASLYEYRALKNPDTKGKSPTAALLILILVGIAFLIFTFNAPKIEIFRDPISGSYGTV